MNVKKVALWVVAVCGWAIQYVLWVPLVLLGRLVRWTLSVGIWALLLLCIPLVGWLILIIVWRSRPRTVRRSSLWRPWLWSRLTT